MRTKIKIGKNTAINEATVNSHLECYNGAVECDNFECFADIILHAFNIMIKKME